MGFDYEEAANEERIAREQQEKRDKKVRLKDIRASWAKTNKLFRKRLRV